MQPLIMKRKYSTGRLLYEFYGENIFRSDIYNADVELGDLLIHEGAAVDAQQNAARVYNADKTYFVMNGTSTANAVVIGSCVSPNDLDYLIETITNPSIMQPWFNQQEFLST